jgi:hypothetical protein
MQKDQKCHLRVGAWECDSFLLYVEIILLKQWKESRIAFIITKMETKIFCDKKTFVRPAHTVQAGSFARIINNVPTQWVYCRDAFQQQTAQGMVEMLFCHKRGMGENVAMFIFRIEEMLKHKNLTLCGPTNIERFMWIRPAKFWIKQPIRRSLFTALLRAGQKYKPDENNFEEALFSDKYLKTSKPAVRRFLAGYTWYTGEVTGGWDLAFRGLKEEGIKDLLTLKPIKDADLINFAAEMLNLTVDELKSKYRKAKFSHKPEPIREPIREVKNAIPEQISA